MATKREHAYKGGRLRPETAAHILGGIIPGMKRIVRTRLARGMCQACGQPKAAHQRF